MIAVKGEWYFQYGNGPILGPFSNSMKAAGLELFAALIKGISSPYIVMGSGTVEAFRKAVGAIIQSGAILRFRTTLSLSEGNGTHTWVGVFAEATGGAGTGIQVNQLNHTFNKNQTQVLNIECRFVLQGV